MPFGEESLLVRGLRKGGGPVQLTTSDLRRPPPSTPIALLTSRNSPPRSKPRRLSLLIATTARGTTLPASALPHVAFRIGQPGTRQPQHRSDIRARRREGECSVRERRSVSPSGTAAGPIMTITAGDGEAGHIYLRGLHSRANCCA